MLGKQKENPKRVLENQLAELAQTTAKQFFKILSSGSEVVYPEVESDFFDKFQTAFVTYCREDIEALQSRIVRSQQECQSAEAWAQGARASQTARGNPTA